MLDKLPPPLQTEIFSYLNRKDIGKSASVCRLFHHHSMDRLDAELTHALEYILLFDLTIWLHANNIFDIENVKQPSVCKLASLVKEAIFSPKYSFLFKEGTFFPKTRLSESSPVRTMEHIIALTPLVERELDDS